MYQQQIRALWDKLIEREFSRFLVVGCINTAFGLTLYFIFNIFVHYQVAYISACACSLYLSYWLNVHWVYKEKTNWRSFFSFPLVYIVQYFVSAVLLHILVEIYGISEWISPVIVIIMTIPITFTLSRYIIKKS